MHFFRAPSCFAFGLRSSIIFSSLCTFMKFVFEQANNRLGIYYSTREKIYFCNFLPLRPTLEKVIVILQKC
jgi:hypothetical protein